MVISDGVLLDVGEEEIELLRRFARDDQVPNATKCNTIWQVDIRYVLMRRFNVI
ncbi:hypothetical protein [Sporolactobacillus shoreae]|uniref:hypothetical protein n=1 Tax=Sporolactobacillus shoreae TaxID=1465501 RepID=UPI001432A151|nr:hypothetical protein [Sporolactobacillus shoreae]